MPADPQEGVRSLTPEGQEAVKQVLNSLDRVAFLTQAGWIPEDLIMPWMHPMIAKSWDKLEPYVEYEKQRRNEPYYYEHASELAVRCRAWREKRLEDAQVKWVKDALKLCCRAFPRRLIAGESTHLLRLAVMFSKYTRGNPKYSER